MKNKKILIFFFYIHPVLDEQILFAFSQILLMLPYYNEDINGILKITVSPVQRKLDQYVQKGTQFYHIKNNIKALYNSHFDLAYELIFQKNGFQYTIAIGNKRYIQEKYNVKDLIQIAESMN
jgi:hypothetical protein